MKLFRSLWTGSQSRVVVIRSRLKYPDCTEVCLELTASLLQRQISV
jgi:hypothetical protein